MAIRHHTAGLINESIVHHLDNAVVDAVVELLTLAPQPNLDNTKGTLLNGIGAEGGVGATGHVANLEGMDDTLGILEIDHLIVVGVKQTEFGHQGVEPLLLVAFQEGAACHVIHRGDIINPFADGIDVHHGASGEDDHMMLLKEGVEQLHHLLFVAGRTVVVSELKCAHHVVRHASQLVGRRGSGADGQVCVELTRIGRDNGCTEALSQFQTERCLAYTRGAQKDQQHGSALCRYLGQKGLNSGRHRRGCSSRPNLQSLRCRGPPYRNPDRRRSSHRGRDWPKVCSHTPRS